MPSYVATDFFPKGVPEELTTVAPTPDYEKLKRQAAHLSGGAYPRDAIKRIILDEHKRLGASGDTLDTIHSIGDGTVFVVAGQQAGLFGGPLYTLYKALHAVRLAERLADDTGNHVVPLFWIASDDHDFAEVRSHTVPSPDGPRVIGYVPGGYRDGMPVGDIVIDQGIEDAIDVLGSSLPKSDEGTRYLDLVKRSWMPGKTWGDAFASWLIGLLGDLGLVVFDPRWHGAKELMAGLFAREIDAPCETSRLVNEAADLFDDPDLREHALRRGEEATNLFLETGGVREALKYDGGFYTASGRYTADEIGGILSEEPHRFSPAASLRPVCQDMLFPVAAMIAGPGERRYLAQLDRVYGMFGVERSIVWPRASFTLVDHRTVRTALKEDVPLTELFGSADAVFAETAKDSFPEDAASDFDTLEESIKNGFGALKQSIRRLDASLAGTVSKELGRVLHITGNLRGRAVRAHKATLDVSRRRITAATEYLMPGGAPQERVYGVDAILPMIEGDHLRDLCRLTSPGGEIHRIIVPEE